MRIGLVGMVNRIEPDPDEAPLLRSLHDHGHEAAVIAWDDADSDLSHYDRCVLRATWNYYRDPDHFIQWLRKAATVTEVWHEPDIVSANIHKRYLLELAERGVPIVPTTLVPAGSHETTEILKSCEWPEVVIKPAIGAGSWETHRARCDSSTTEQLLANAIATRDTLIQPFLTEVANGAEVNVIVIDGMITHAVRKAPRWHDGTEAVTAAPLEPRHREFAASVLSAVDHNLRYARIDMVEMRDGTLRLSELELIEPSLFFDHSPVALDRFVTMLTS